MHRTKTKWKIEKGTSYFSEFDTNIDENAINHNR